MELAIWLIGNKPVVHDFALTFDRSIKIPQPKKRLRPILWHE
jgi:hypothetical protein